RRGDKEVYFRRSIGWSYMGGGNKKNFSFLKGSVSGTGTPIILTEDDTEYYYMVGFLNTKIPEMFISIFNPTLNTYISDLTNLPYISSDSRKGYIKDLVEASIKIGAVNWNSSENS